MQQAYEAACHEHGHEPGPVFLPDRDTPSVIFVADDVDKALAAFRGFWGTWSLSNFATPSWGSLVETP
jgi:hypothetical protein